MSVQTPQQFLDTLIYEQLYERPLLNRKGNSQRQYRLWVRPSCIDCFCHCTPSGGSSGDRKAETICWLIIALITLIISTFACAESTVRTGALASRQGNKIRQVEGIRQTAEPGKNDHLVDPLLVLLKDDYNQTAVNATSLGFCTVGFAFFTAAVIFAIYIESTRGRHTIPISLSRTCSLGGGSSFLMALLMKGGHEVYRASNEGYRTEQRVLLRTNYENPPPRVLPTPSAPPSDAPAPPGGPSGAPKTASAPPEDIGEA